MRALMELLNAAMRVVEIRRFCRSQDKGQSLVQKAVMQPNLSTSEYHRILIMTRTVVRLLKNVGVQSVHLADAF